mgnify:FL=1
MKVIYEHDDDEDFVEIHLTSKELEALDNEQMLQQSYPAMIHTRRSSSFLLRKMKVIDE